MRIDPVRREPARVFAWVAIALALLPFVVGAFQTLFGTGGYHPPGDMASIELQVRDVGRHPVLVGLFSRATWHHPGPAFFYLLAVPYRLLGSTSSAIYIGALAINAAAVVGAALIARRHGGIALMLCTLIGLSVMNHSLGADFLRSPWNPWLTVLPYALMIFLTWAMTCGDWWALPCGVFVASFLMQTHVGYVLLALPLLVIGTVMLFVRARHVEHVRRKATRAVVVGIGIAVVMWTPPLIDQFTHTPANLGEIVHYFAHPDEPTQSFGVAWRIVSGEFGKRPEWVTGALPLVRFIAGGHIFALHAPAPVLLLPFALAIAVFAVRKQRAAVWFGAVVAVSFATGIVAVVRTVGIPLAYRLRWTWVIAALAMVLVLWALWTLITARWSRRAPALLTTVALVAIGGVSIATSVDAATAGMPVSGSTVTMNSLVRQALPQVPKGGGTVLVLNPQLDSFWVPGLVLALERRRDSVKTAPDPASLLGDHRLYKHGPLRTVLRVVTGPDAVFMPAPEGTHELAFWAPCARDQQIRERPARLLLDSDFENRKISAQDYYAKLLTLCDPAYDVAIIMQPA